MGTTLALGLPGVVSGWSQWSASSRSRSPLVAIPTRKPVIEITAYDMTAPTVRAELVEDRGQEHQVSQFSQGVGIVGSGRLHGPECSGDSFLQFLVHGPPPELVSGLPSGRAVGQGPRAPPGAAFVCSPRDPTGCR